MIAYETWKARADRLYGNSDEFKMYGTVVYDRYGNVVDQWEPNDESWTRPTASPSSPPTVGSVVSNSISGWTTWAAAAFVLAKLIWG